MEDISGIVVCSFVLLLLIGIGSFLRSGRGAFLISGYNMLSKEKKARYNEKALCRFTGNLLFLVAFYLIFAVIGGIYNIVWLVKLILTLIILTVIAGIIYVNTNESFKT